MKRSTPHLPVVLLAALGLAAFAASTWAGGNSSDPERRCAHGAAATDAEYQAVAATVKLYFQGHATGNGEFFRRAFHPEAKLFWVKDGALAQRTSAEFVAGAAGKPADDEARRARRIAMIDIAGDAAVARVELDYPDASLVDYLSLLRLDGKWVVINKIFHRGAPKPAVPSHK